MERLDSFQPLGTPMDILAQLGPATTGSGTEWMIAFSILAPIVLLIAILWYGHRNTV